MVEKPSRNLIIVKHDALSEGAVQVYRVLCLPETIAPFLRRPV
jgi:hypothetical protein